MYLKKFIILNQESAKGAIISSNLRLLKNRKIQEFAEGAGLNHKHFVSFCVFPRQDPVGKIKTENGVLDSINHEFGGFSCFDKIKNAKV